MNKDLFKRIAITLSVPLVLLLVGLIFTYQLIPINWVSSMEIQSSFRPLEDPLPLPARSVPVQGVAYLPGAGNPANPITADQASIERGKTFYINSCYVCHGGGDGAGPVAEKLTRKPADLTAVNVQELSDGEIFMIITSGIKFSDNQISMPDLRENLAVSDRWDVVNYVRSLQQP